MGDLTGVHNSAHASSAIVTGRPPEEYGFQKRDMRTLFQMRCCSLLAPATHNHAVSKAVFWS
jgi:hypothetical protein